MTIEEIYKKEEISVRSYNVCKYNELHSVSDLKKYYYKNESFEKLRNCGRKSNEELIEICNKYQEELLEKLETELKKEHPLKTIISELTRVQREVINSFILVNTNSLTVRSKNAISLYLGKNFKIKNFAEKVFFNSVDIKHWKNVGTKSVPEIEIYISIIRDFILDVSQKREEKQLIRLKNNFLIQRTFSISKIPNEILETESIFLLTNFLLNNNALFDETRTIIVKRAFKIYNNQKELSLDEIADEINLTRERVRQIRVLCLEDLFNKLTFIQNFKEDLFEKYNIDTNSNLIEINEDIVDAINTLNKINLSQEFITYILFAYFSNEFSLIGNIEDVLQPKYFNARNRHNWNNFYLINKNVASEIDFAAFANDINTRNSERIEELYSFNFKSYLSKFLTNGNINILNSILPIAEKMVNIEFELYLDLDENIIFKRNTFKKVYEYAFEALEALNKPSKLNLILNKVKESNPDFTLDESSLRAAMARKNGFVPIGKNSIFGLKKWEKEQENFKGGTIKNIVFEYLEEKDNPIHIYELLEEVHKYRDTTNAKNVITNLKSDPRKQFVIFNQSFIGLISKKYSSNLTSLPKFLGKKITNFVSQNPNQPAAYTIIHFSKLYNIDIINSSYILNQLIDNKFLSFTNN